MYSAGMLLMFWAVFDGILAYILPVLITDLGYTATQMGLLIASSNIFGALFDFVLAKFITNTNYRRLFLVIYGLCFIYPLLLWQAKTIPLFLISMFIWGLYGDLQTFAQFDFVNRRVKKENYSQSVGVMDVFKCLGYLIAPIVAGLVVIETIDFFPFSLSLSFLLISLIFYLILVQLSPKRDSAEYDQTPKYTKYNFFKEFKVIKSVGKILWPVLLFNVLLHIFDSAIWTIGPLFAQYFDTNFKDFGGYFMAAYMLPSVTMGWLVGTLCRRFGKKKTAMVSFFLSCLFMIPISFLKIPSLIIFFMLVSSIGSSLAWPALRSAYSDYINESHSYSKEIEGLNDFSSNIGYIIGPIVGGVMADLAGVQNVFTILAVAGVIAVEILFLITPKHIQVVIHRE